MIVRRVLVTRLHRLLLYWGLLSHPYGREYVRERYTPTGGRSRSR